MRSLATYGNARAVKNEVGGGGVQQKRCLFRLTLSYRNASNPKFLLRTGSPKKTPGKKHPFSLAALTYSLPFRFQEPASRTIMHTGIQHRKPDAEFGESRREASARSPEVAGSQRGCEYFIGPQQPPRSISGEKPLPLCAASFKKSPSQEVRARAGRANASHAGQAQKVNGVSLT